MYLEKWNRIDYNRVKFLQAEPRYPDLPSYSTCIPTFEQPSNWDDFFGTRLRTYFVPTEEGYHYFMICKFLALNLTITCVLYVSLQQGPTITKSSTHAQTQILGKVAQVMLLRYHFTL